jgi:Icc-related predicted phosphoesterase
VRIAATADLHFSASRHSVLHDQLSRVRDEADVLVLAGDLTNVNRKKWNSPERRSAFPSSYGCGTKITTMRVESKLN